MSVRSFFSALLLLPWVALAARIDVVFPAKNAKLPNIGQCHVIGSCDPSVRSFTCNGVSVKPFKTGAFLFMQPVRPGKNKLVFSAGGVKSEHCFNVAEAPSRQGGNRIRPLFPCCPVGVLTGESVPLSCIAPTGRIVRAMVGERDIPMRESRLSPGRYEASVKFNGCAEQVPVLFWSEGLPDAVAGSISAKGAWGGKRVTANLFEARVYDRPDGNTIGFLPPKFKFGTTGFAGEWARTELGGKVCYVPMRSLKDSPGVKFSSGQQMPDIAKSFPAKPAPGCRRSDVLVVIDAGHGGDDPGAVGPRRIKEKDVNLSQAKAIEKKLKEAGYRTLMTRDKDVFVGLYDRVRFAYGKKASAFISVHHNATGVSGNPDAARNVITYCSNDRGAALAQCIQRAIAPVAGIPDGGVGRKSLAVCRNPAVPSCLIEFDFITSPAGELASSDRKRQERFAAAVLRGLDVWAGQQSANQDR